MAGKGESQSRATELLAQQGHLTRARRHPQHERRLCQSVERSTSAHTVLSPLERQHGVELQRLQDLAYRHTCENSSDTRLERQRPRCTPRRLGDEKRLSLTRLHPQRQDTPRPPLLTQPKLHPRRELCLAGQPQHGFRHCARRTVADHHDYGDRLSPRQLGHTELSCHQQDGRTTRKHFRQDCRRLLFPLGQDTAELQSRCRVPLRLERRTRLLQP